jgi:SH2 domain-containing protein 4A
VLQPKKVAQRVALWEKRVMEERTSEIFKRLQKKQMEVVREAEEAEHKQEQLWREQGTRHNTFSDKRCSSKVQGQCSC